jgi:copper chaperone CopZ
MTKIFILFIALATFTCCQQSQKNTENNTDSAVNLNEAAIITAEFKISGMTCTGCENTIKAKIEKLDGIKSVTASHTGGNAIVAYDTTKTDMLQIAETINSCGYKTENFQKK